MCSFIVWMSSVLIYNVENNKKKNKKKHWMKRFVQTFDWYCTFNIHSDPGHGNSKCCIAGSWTCFSFLKMLEAFGTARTVSALIQYAKSEKAGCCPSKPLYSLIGCVLAVWLFWFAVCYHISAVCGRGRILCVLCFFYLLMHVLLFPVFMFWSTGTRLVPSAVKKAQEEFSTWRTRGAMWGCSLWTTAQHLTPLFQTFSPPNCWTTDPPPHLQLD